MQESAAAMELGSYLSQYRIFGFSPHVFQQFFFIFARVGNLLEVNPLGQLELAFRYPSWSWYSQTVKFHVPNKLGKMQLRQRENGRRDESAIKFRHSKGSKLEGQSTDTIAEVS